MSESSLRIIKLHKRSGASELVNNVESVLRFYFQIKIVNMYLLLFYSVTSAMATTDLWFSKLSLTPLTISIISRASGPPGYMVFVINDSSHEIKLSNSHWPPPPAMPPWWPLLALSGIKVRISLMQEQEKHWWDITLPWDAHKRIYSSLCTMAQWVHNPSSHRSAPYIYLRH